MFKFREIFTALLLFALVLHFSIIDAGYISEETDEKSKSLFSAVTSILGSTESSKHQHKQKYDSPPCASGGCPSIGSTYDVGYGPSNPCNSPTGCPSTPQSSQYGNAISNGYDGASGVASRPTFGVHPQFPSSYGGHGHSPYAQQASAGFYGSAPPVTNLAPTQAYVNTGFYGSVPQPSYQASSGAYQPGVAPHYGHWNSNPSHNSYQGPRGYSVFDHSLKTNSEYTEVGSHTGPLQRATNGNGYGSGYGGYNGLFNRPGF